MAIVLDRLCTLAQLAHRLLHIQWLRLRLRDHTTRMQQMRRVLADDERAARHAVMDLADTHARLRLLHLEVAALRQPWADTQPLH